MEKQSILVIDDNPEILELQKLILEADGFNVIASGSAHEAFDVLSKIDFPKLILLDFQMDEMNGTEFLERLEKVNPQLVQEVPVVFLSAMDLQPSGKVVGFIRKFPDIPEYLAAIHKFIKMDGRPSSTPNV